MCSQCSDDYFFDSVAGICESCGNSGISVIMIIVIILMVFLIATPLIVALLRWKLMATSTFLRDHNHASAVLCLAAVHIYATLRCYSKQQRADTEDAMRSYYEHYFGEEAEEKRDFAKTAYKRFFKNIMGPKAKVYVGFLQIVAALPFVLGIQYPKTFTAMSGMFSLLNINLKSVGIECYYKGDYVDYLLLATIGPMIFTIVFGLCYCLHYAIANSIRQNTTTLLGKYFYIFVFVVSRIIMYSNCGTNELFEYTFMWEQSYVILPGVVTIIFRTFPCVDVDPEVNALFML